MAMLIPRPKMRLNNWPEMVPAQAISAYPWEARAVFVNRSARLLPIANKVQERRVLLKPWIIE